MKPHAIGHLLVVALSFAMVMPGCTKTEIPTPTPKEQPAGKPALPVAQAPSETGPSPVPAAVPSVEKPVERTGILSKTMKVTDFFARESTRSTGTRAKVVLWSGETWVLEDPRGNVSFPDSPTVYDVSVLSVSGKDHTTYVPSCDVESITSREAGASSERCRCVVALRSGIALQGGIHGSVAGRCELGTASIPWKCVKSAVFEASGCPPSDPLPVSAPGECTLRDGSRVAFQSWAPVVGDVLSDVMLIEGSNGPQLSPLGAKGSLRIVGRDENVLFWTACVQLDPPAQNAANPCYTALQCVLVLRKSWGFVRIPVSELQSIEWSV